MIFLIAPCKLCRRGKKNQLRFCDSSDNRLDRLGKNWFPLLFWPSIPFVQPKAVLKAASPRIFKFLNEKDETNVYKKLQMESDNLIIEVSYPVLIEIIMFTSIAKQLHYKRPFLKVRKNFVQEVGCTLIFYFKHYSVHKVLLHCYW